MTSAAKRSIEELLTELERSDDRAIYAVLADALVEHGDPRGELAQNQFALDSTLTDASPLWPRAFAHRAAFDRTREDTAATTATIRGREAAQLGVLVQQQIAARTAALVEGLPPYHGLKLEFRYGMLDRITVGVSSLSPEDLGRTLGKLLASPEGRLVRILEISPSLSIRPSNYFKDVLDGLAAVEVAGTRAPALQTLACGTIFPGSDYQFSGGEDPADDLSSVFTTFPDLVELWVHVGALDLQWPALTSTSLRHLTFITPSINSTDLTAFAEAHLPALESFVMWTGSSHYVNERDEMNDDTPGRYFDVKQFEPVFEMLDTCPALRTLGIGNFVGDVPWLVNAIADHPFAAQIETLDLSSAVEVDGALLAPQLDRFPALRTVVIDHVDVRNQSHITRNNRELVGGYTYGLGRFRYVTHQE